ncbi:unnamed protein product [Phaedon cochleariae]|uniref:Uncharacterized protein n=1 Tax=Phaedon cochleariae TaxID=80249 RepID=A0A9P0GXE2_PHACE|nr:unnamed protein product [Phaedon cochleariae]
MSTLERKEYQETKIMRTLSPVRSTYSSNQNVSQFDNNLDHLLEDLQNSVSRPGSSLGHTTNYKDSSRSVSALDAGRTNSLSRITNLKSANPATEYSSDDAYSYKSPDGRQQISGYKKEKYIYKTSGDVVPEKTRMQSSINQLDTLLDDLQQAKKSSFTEKESYNGAGVDPELQSVYSKQNVNRELHYGDSPISHSSRNQTIERNEREGSIRRDVQYTSEGSYMDSLQRRRTTSPTPKTATLTKRNVREYPAEVLETTPGTIDPEVLAHLDPNLRPPGNTKVTTTIKTYTYEIPGSPTGGEFSPSSANVPGVEEKYVYSPNRSGSMPSQSFVYSSRAEDKENLVYQQEGYQKPYQKPSPPGGVVVKETVTTRNYQPGYRADNNPPTTNQTYFYNESSTTKNVLQNGHPQPPPMPRQDTYIVKDSTTTTTNINKTDHHRNYPPSDDYPPHKAGYSPNNDPGWKKTYVIKETHNTINKTEPPFSERGYPVYNPPDNNRGNPPHTTYVIKESHNTTTNHQRAVSPPPPSQQNGSHPHQPGKTMVYRHESHTTNNYEPPRQTGNRPRTPDEVETFDPRGRHPPAHGYEPNEPINIHYSYKSTNTTQNRFGGAYPPNEENQPLLPGKFPNSEITDGPPKKLDELMATIGHEPPNSPLNAGFTAHEQDLAHQKKIDTLKKQSSEADDAQRKEQIAKTKNVSGPAVYYPPGEMFVKKEEGEAAWRAQGGYAKASGKYQYEAESKSKMKSSSGATVVPVCLPLCCGLPCVLL